MTLPIELVSIFRNKQKSYKMVLILSMLDLYDKQQPNLALIQVAERFLNYYQRNTAEGNRVDNPPSGVATNWGDFTLAQIKALLKTPIDALSSLLTATADTIAFKPEI